MKKILILFVLPLLSATAMAQGFRYDTIRPSQQSSRSSQGFRYETPSQTPATPAASSTGTQPVQTVRKGFDPGKLRIGGGIGLGINNDYTSINVSPQVGYALTDYLTAGAGVAYNHTRDSHYDATRNYLGGNLYLRFTPVPYFIAQIQPEYYGMWGRVRGIALERRSVPVVLVGAGINIPLGGRGGMSAMVYCDLVGDEWSPYPDRVIYSLGYTFAF